MGIYWCCLVHYLPIKPILKDKDKIRLPLIIGAAILLLAGCQSMNPNIEDRLKYPPEWPGLGIDPIKNRPINTTNYQYSRGLGNE